MTDRNAALVDVSPALVEVLKEVNNLNTDGPSMSGILQKQAFKTLKWRSWKPRWCEIRGITLTHAKLTRRQLFNLFGYERRYCTIGSYSVT